MFQTVFQSITRSSKLHIQSQVFVRPMLLPAASMARLAAGSSIGRLLVVLCELKLLLLSKSLVLEVG